MCLSDGGLSVLISVRLGFLGSVIRCTDHITSSDVFESQVYI